VLYTTITGQQHTLEGVAFGTDDEAIDTIEDRVKNLNGVNPVIHLRASGSSETVEVMSPSTGTAVAVYKPPVAIPQPAVSSWRLSLPITPTEEEKKAEFITIGESHVSQQARV